MFKCLRKKKVGNWTFCGTESIFDLKNENTNNKDSKSFPRFPFVVLHSSVPTSVGSARKIKREQKAVS